jgi:hypothetical protein
MKRSGHRAGDGCAQPNAIALVDGADGDAGNQPTPFFS